MTFNLEEKEAMMFEGLAIYTVGDSVHDGGGEGCALRTRNSKTGGQEETMRPRQISNQHKEIIYRK